MWGEPELERAICVQEQMEGQQMRKTIDKLKSRDSRQ